MPALGLAVCHTIVWMQVIIQYEDLACIFSKGLSSLWVMYVPLHLETIHRNLIGGQDIQEQGSDLQVPLHLLEKGTGD